MNETGKKYFSEICRRYFEIFVGKVPEIFAIFMHDIN